MNRTWLTKLAVTFPIPAGTPSGMPPHHNRINRKQYGVPR
jgi:hypothetical protein